MAAPIQNRSEQRPLVRAAGSGDYIEERRGRRLPSKPISPVAYGRVDNGPASSSLFMTASSNATSQQSSVWSHENTNGYDDDLYSLTDDESIEVPLIASNSVKEQAAKSRAKYPPLVIPRAGQWPQPPRAKQPHVVSFIEFSASNPPPTASPASSFAKSIRLNGAPSGASTPSLDGSFTSDGLASSRCPSTPEAYSPKADGWEAPVQLDAEAFAVLRQLSRISSNSQASSPSTSPIIPHEALEEMKEVVRECIWRDQDRQARPRNSVLPRPSTISEPVSAMTVPSPSTFFGSLEPSTRQTWCVGTPPPPSTGTAERFYRLPWRNYSPPREGRSSPGVLPPARLCTTLQDTMLTEHRTTEATEIVDQALVHRAQESPDETLLRTKEWLGAQLTWMINLSGPSYADNVKSCFSPETIVPSTPETSASSITYIENTPSSKKSVRFLQSVPEGAVPKFEDAETEAQDIFLEGFRYMSKRFRSRDTFLHGQARAEASHIMSTISPARHSALLRGNFRSPRGQRTTARDPISPITAPETEDDMLKETIVRAGHEREALEQLQSSVWELHASQEVFGSRLLTSPIVEKLKSQPEVRVLDFGGGVSCNWAWAVALRYRNSTVFTIPLDSTQIPTQPLTGPANHKVIRPGSLMSLPFPNNHFDVISARSLHVMLRTRFPDSTIYPGKDEYDLALAEFIRILKPGGVLEFNLMDAELFHPGPLGKALSNDLASALRQFAYDPQASRYFLPRLRNAGFAEVKRAWLVLPCADVLPTWTDRGRPCIPVESADGTSLPTERSRRGHVRQDSAFEYIGPPAKLPEVPLVGSTSSVRALTGLVGARAWERWILALQREMGGDEEAMLARINRALEEGGRKGAGWRCLVGWARKAGGE